MGCYASHMALRPKGVEPPYAVSLPNDIGGDLYRIGKLLGAGAFGHVRECCRTSDGHLFAVKIMERKDTSAEHMFRREVEVLASLDNPNVIKYVEFFEDRHFLYTVLERCSGGELFDHIVTMKRFTEQEAASLCRQMLNALDYVHASGVVHRDIKAENFLFKGDGMTSELKLIDFGMSVKMAPDNQRLTELCGSPHYLSPELIRKRYNSKADMWAFGVLTYLMLYGRYPFDGKSTESIVKQILRKPVNFSNSEVSLSAAAIDFMRQLLQRDPTKRPSALNALQHVWLQDTAHEFGILPEIIDQTGMKGTRSDANNFRATFGPTKYSSMCFHLPLRDLEDALYPTVFVKLNASGRVPMACCRNLKPTVVAVMFKSQNLQSGGKDKRHIVRSPQIIELSKEHAASYCIPFCAQQQRSKTFSPRECWNCKLTVDSRCTANTSSYAIDSSMKGGCTSFRSPAVERPIAVSLPFPRVQTVCAFSTSWSSHRQPTCHLNVKCRSHIGTAGTLVIATPTTAVTSNPEASTSSRFAEEFTDPTDVPGTCSGTVPCSRALVDGPFFNR